MEEQCELGKMGKSKLSASQATGGQIEIQMSRLEKTQISRVAGEGGQNRIMEGQEG